jgi:small subunit ribosomal protein S6
MRYYETIYIVDPNLENTILEKTMTEIGQELEKTKAKIINHRDWGKKRLAYQVDNQKYGSFILLQYEIKELSKMNDFDIWLKLNSLVLRHMTVSLDKKPDKYIEKTSVSEVAQSDDTSSPSDKNDNKIDVEKSLDPEKTETNKEE